MPNLLSRHAFMNFPEDEQLNTHTYATRGALNLNHFLKIDQMTKHLNISEQGLLV